MMFERSKVVLTAAGDIIASPWRKEAERQEAFKEASKPLARELGQLHDLETEFETPSIKSRPGHKWPMVRTPEGYAVHTGEGCIGEQRHGPLGCHHSKENSIVTSTAMVPVESVLTPAPIEFNPEQLKVIKESIAKGATDTELALFVSTCKRTGLDPFVRQIYAVKRYDSRERKEVMAIQVGIDGLRLIAERTGRYAGQDPIEWLDEDGVWSEVWTGKGAYPVAARAAVYRKDWTKKAPAVARWSSYAQTYQSNNQTVLMPTWKKMPDVMLGKCAEALALRRAFPAEMSGIAALADPDFDHQAFEAENRAADPRLSTPPMQAFAEQRAIVHGDNDEEGEENFADEQDRIAQENVGDEPDGQLDPDAIPFDPPVSEPATEGQRKAITANGKMLAWTDPQLEENVRERQNKELADLTEYEASSVIEWQVGLLEAKGKKGARA